MMSRTAIDLGFMFTQAIINGKPIIIKSVVGNGRTLSFKDLDMGLEKDKDSITCVSDGEKYFVSDLAIDQSDTVIHSLKPNRFNTGAVRTLVETVLGMGLGNGHHTTKVVSGLPVSHYSKFKEQIEVLFMKDTHRFSLDINEVSVCGRVTVSEGIFIPQPFGALMDEVLDIEGRISNKQLATKTVAVVDIGFGTTDIYVVNSLTPIEKFTFSTETAMNHAYSLISNKIEEITGIVEPLYAIESVVRTKRYRKHGKLLDMSSVVNWAMKVTSEQLLSELYNKWKRMDEVDHMQLVGGGAIQLSPYILPEASHIHLSKNSQWVVVKGYEKWGNRMWKDS